MAPPTFCATSTVLLWLVVVEVGAAVPCVATAGPRPASVGLGVFILGVFLCIWLAFWLLGCLVREQVYVMCCCVWFECCALSLSLFSTHRERDFAACSSVTAATAACVASPSLRSLPIDVALWQHAKQTRAVSHV